MATKKTRLVYAFLMVVVFLVGLFFGAMKHNSVCLEENIMSFESAYNQLDYAHPLFSNVERCDIMDAKTDMVNARNLSMINQLIISHDTNEVCNWRMEKDAWEVLSEDIHKFIVAKMEEQWHTGKTGTAGSSYESCCRYNLAVARTLLLESVFVAPDTIISDKNKLIDFTTLSNKVPQQIIKDDLVTDIVNYLETYISSDFIIWENREGSDYHQWNATTSSLIRSLKDDLNTYINAASIAYPSLNSQGMSYLFWILQQLGIIIKIGD